VSLFDDKEITSIHRRNEKKSINGFPVKFGLVLNHSVFVGKVIYLAENHKASKILMLHFCHCYCLSLGGRG